MNIRNFRLSNFASSIAFATSVLISGSAVFAQDNDPCSCDVALKKDIVRVIKSKNQSEAFLKSIDESTYKAFKQELHLLESIPVPEIGQIIKNSLDYSSFDEDRRRYLENVSYSSNESESLDILKITTAPVAYEAWSKCKEVCARTHSKSDIWKIYEDKNYVDVKVFYYADPGVGQAPIKGTVRNGKVIEIDSETVTVPEGNLFLNDAIIMGNGSRVIRIERINPKLPVLISATISPPQKNPTTLSESAIWAQTWNVTVTQTFSSSTPPVKSAANPIYFDSPDSVDIRHLNRVIIKASAGRTIHSVAKPIFEKVLTDDYAKNFKLANSKVKKGSWGTISKLYAQKYIKSYKKESSKRTKLESLVIAPPNTATMLFSTWWLPTRWRVDFIEKQKNTVNESTTTTYQMAVGQNFSLKVMKDATATFDFVSENESEPALQPGITSNKVQFVRKTGQNGYDLYVYRINDPSTPTANQ